jgi:hypothetical protein
MTTINDELDEERGLHFLEFKEFGIDPIPMSEGQKVELEMKNPEQRRVWTYYEGNPDDAKNIPGQDNDFVTEDGSYIYWTNRYVGLFPGLLYVK